MAKKKTLLSRLKVCGNRRLSKEQQRMWDAFEFLARLLLLSIPLYLLLGLGVSELILKPAQEAVAAQSAWILEQTGFRASQGGAYVATYPYGGGEPFNFMINEDCTGWKSMLFLFALMFAVPGIALSKRLIGLVFGLPAIWIGNLARVVGVVLAEKAYGVEAALMIHDYLWQLGLIALVLGIWIIWLWSASTKRKKPLWERLKGVLSK